MRQRWVVDASVAAKWLAPENESLQAQALLDDELLVPDLLFAEVANILWKKESRGEMDSATAAAACHWLTQVPLAVHASAVLMREALDLSLRLHQPAYDCLYLALAQREACTLVTADRRLRETCKQVNALADCVVSLIEVPT